jgi:hypothetical protein
MPVVVAGIRILSGLFSVLHRNVGNDPDTHLRVKEQSALVFHSHKNNKNVYSVINGAPVV